MARTPFPLSQHQSGNELLLGLRRRVTRNPWLRKMCQEVSKGYLEGNQCQFAVYLRWNFEAIGSEFQMSCHKQWNRHSLVWNSRQVLIVAVFCKIFQAWIIV